MEEMRELTFKGFLTKYVKQLSKQETNSLYKLTTEASTDNPRLKEPLLLFAVCSQKQDVLLSAAKNTSLSSEYQRMLSQYSAEAFMALLESGSQELPAEYHKVWRTYLSRKNRMQADDHTKELIRQKVRRLQEKSGVTNYRIYTDLNLNPGNLNAWLKHGIGEKVSLDTARNTLRYVENCVSLQNGI